MKKKSLTILLCGMGLFVGAIGILNMGVTTQQGINYKWHSVKLPLYLKLLDFFDRHYNYKLLVRSITDGAKSEEEKAMMIFKWTCQNIKRTPNGLPVVDDHVWHIIIRGHGVTDQFSDVFCTLCNYVGIDAFFMGVRAKDKSSGALISFVRLNEKWRLFDPYHAGYFITDNGALASVEDVMSGNWHFEELKEIERSGDLYYKAEDDYKESFANMPLVQEPGLLRSSVQSPLNRLIYEFQKWTKK